MSIKKIALVGKMRSGKDTVAEILSDYGYSEYKLGAGIGDTVELLFSDGEHGLSKRALYQKIGQDMREIDSHVWIKKMFKRIESHNPSLIVISDVRQRNEELALREAGYTIVKVVADAETRIRRIEAVEKFDLKAFDHETELSVDDVRADITINNSKGIPELVGEVYSKLLNLK